MGRFGIVEIVIILAIIIAVIGSIIGAIVMYGKRQRRADFDAMQKYDDEQNGKSMT